MDEISQITIPVRNPETGILENVTYKLTTDTSIFEEIVSLFHAETSAERLVNSNDAAYFTEPLTNFVLGIVVFKTNKEYFVRVIPTEMIPLAGSLKICEMAYLPSVTGKVTLPLTYYASNTARLYEGSIVMDGCSYTEATFKIGVCDVYGCMRKAGQPTEPTGGEEPQEL